MMQDSKGLRPPKFLKKRGQATKEGGKEVEDRK
jgi:hypothetical protein